MNDKYKGKYCPIYKDQIQTRKCLEELCVFWNGTYADGRKMTKPYCYYVRSHQVKVWEWEMRE